jgi:CRISPR-associated endonuclease/helicase Cas3
LDKIADSPEAVRDLLRNELKGGGCAVVICNTVGRAQDTYRLLRDSFDGTEVGIGLFHARFLAKDRQRIETDCLHMFGPDSPQRPQRYVLVATQVVEQSLDIDFDVMVTDLAPVDLLLQRSGRLHRHERPNRPGGPALVLHIRWPEESGDAPPTFDGPSTYVYDEHILLRTWHALRDRDAISIPEDIQDLVDLVYRDDEGLPKGAGEELAKKWAETWAAMQKKKQEERREAMDRTVRKPDGPIAHPSDFQRFEREEDSPELHPALQALTRLAEPTVSVVLLPEGSPLEPKGSEAPNREKVRALVGQSVSLSSWLAVNALFKQEVPKAFQASPALRRHRLLILDGNGEASVEGVRFSYDPQLGLEITREDGR